MSCTVDACVFVSASRPTDPHFPASRHFLRQVRTEGEQVVCPTLVLPECAAAIFRATGDAELVREVVAMVERFPRLEFVSLDRTRADKAAGAAVRCRLKGADAVYLGVAEEFGTVLVTWDAEILQRASTTVSTLTPDQWKR